MIPANETEGHVIVLPSHWMSGALYDSSAREFNVHRARISLLFGRAIYLQGHFTDTEEYFGITVPLETEFEVIS